MVKTLGKGTLGDLISAVKKPFAGASKEAVEAMSKKWAREGATEAGEKATKEVAEKMSQQADELLGDFGRLLKISDKTSAKLNKELMDSVADVVQSQKNARSYLRFMEEEKQKILRNAFTNAQQLGKYQDIKGIDQVSRDMIRDVLSERLAVYDEYVTKIPAVQKQIQDLTKIANLTTNPNTATEALSMAVRDPSLSEWGMANYVVKMKNISRQLDQIYRAKSKNLGSDTAFLQEYLKVKRNPHIDESIFAAQPDNAMMIRRLYSKDRLVDVLNRGKLTTREKITGITPKDWAQRLGISSVAAGTAAGAIGIYNWFVGNDPSGTAQTSNDSGKMAFRTSGDASDIQKQTTNSLRNITEVSQKANELMRSNPQEAVSVYVAGISKELFVLDRLLDQWDMVVKNSDNPTEAKNTHQQIAQFADRLSTQITQLGRQAGFNAGVAYKAPRKDPNISKIQGVMGLNTTGVLDEETVSALQGLEKKYTRLSKDEDFIGAFVNPATNWVVDYNDLIEASSRIKKY